jgi:uncharacterized protein YecE (DUF72 family)
MIRIGTCSWKYDSWKGLVYSENTGKDYLPEYASHFNTVEIDQWFWSLFAEDKVVLPQPNVVKSYFDAVPDDFRFTIKIPNSITLTHFYQKDKSKPLQPNPYFLSNKLFYTFLKSIEPMISKIGMLMFQFEYLNKLKMKSQIEFLQKFGDFNQQIDTKLHLAIEIRNPYYLNTKYFDFLNKNNLSPVLLQGYYMPPIFDTFFKYANQINNSVVIRLHGPDRSEIEKKSGGNWSKILEPRDNDISKITKIIKDLDSKNLDVFVNVNNHYEGSAPRTIQKIRDQLQIDNF